MSSGVAWGVLVSLEPVASYQVSALHKSGGEQWGQQWETESNGDGGGELRDAGGSKGRGSRLADWD